MSTLCIVNTRHGELTVREFVHPNWRGIVSALFCPVCGRAWLLVRGTYSELDLRTWKELANVGL